VSDQPKVAVAMSGGVDSSVAAALLRGQGCEVSGIMLSLWADPDTEFENRCCASNAVALARRVAAQLEIPFQLLDASDAFYRSVVQPMMNAYAAGRTPNPCLECNRSVRWDFLLQRALETGADFLATGHYAQIGRDGGLYTLLRGADAQKDQSYVLSVLGQDELAHTMFPLGAMTKPEVRAEARRLRLPVAERPDSQDLCFVAGKDYRRFLRKYNPGGFVPGPIRNRRGETLGEHAGLAGYTVGQRKGLGLSSPSPLYVLAVDAETNALIVGSADELGHHELVAGDAHWVAGFPPAGSFTAGVKIRYQAVEQPAEVILEAGDTLRARFAGPLRDITPGQAAVFYQGDRCLGMAVIREAIT
jgi:tRNA-specific 2-thiouridylase